MEILLSSHAKHSGFKIIITSNSPRFFVGYSQ